MIKFKLNNMKKEEIVTLAESMNFKLDYDKSDDEVLPYIRFVSVDDELDEKDLRWIWLINETDADNIDYGKYIQSRLVRKRQVLNSLKY